MVAKELLINPKVKEQPMANAEHPEVLVRDAVGCARFLTLLATPTALPGGASRTSSSLFTCAVHPRAPRASPRMPRSTSTARVSGRLRLTALTLRPLVRDVH